MGITIEQAQAKEKKARKAIMRDLLKRNGLTEEDVKTMRKDTQNAISIIQHEDGIEQIVLWKRADESKKFRIEVDYEFTLDENPKDRRSRKERREKK